MISCAGAERGGRGRSAGPPAARRGAESGGPVTNRHMLMRVLLALTLAAVSCSSRSFDEQKPAVGEPAPSLAVADLAGRMFRLADLRGKVVLLNFWAAWCPPCKAEMPGFQRVYLAHEEQGFVVVAVAIHDVTPAEVRSLGILFPVLIATDQVKRDYGDPSFPPVSFLVGRDGRIIKKVKKYYPEEELKVDVRRALQG